MIKITDNARSKMIDVLVDEKSSVLRFGLQGGGCSGFQYFFSVDQTKEDDDTVYPLDDSHVLVVDPISMTYLEESEIDYKKDLMGESFTFHNPSQKTSCGCGNSVGFD
jgi:iron-sulfur cluster insertion protein